MPGDNLSGDLAVGGSAVVPGDNLTGDLGGSCFPMARLLGCLRYGWCPCAYVRDVHPAWWLDWDGACPEGKRVYV
jgi:hypothetical protein